MHLRPSLTFYSLGESDGLPLHRFSTHKLALVDLVDSRIVQVELSFLNSLTRRFCEVIDEIKAQGLFKSSQSLVNSAVI